MNKNCCKKMKNNLTPTPLLDKEREKLLMSEESLTNSGEVKKCGFSLAEAMVMLVIVAILMALSAPLIAKRSSADAKKLVQQNTVYTDPVRTTDNNFQNSNIGNGFTSIFSALSGNQNFGIGTRTPNAKLHVQGGNNTADILNVTTSAGISANAANDTGLFVRRNGNNAEVNIVACEPDWNRVSAIPLDGGNHFTEDGYLLVGTCANINGNTVCPPVYPTSINCTAGGNCVGEDYVYTDANTIIVIPVNRGAVYTLPIQDPIGPGIHRGIPNSSTPGVGGLDNQFLPCREGYKVYHRGL